MGAPGPVQYLDKLVTELSVRKVPQSTIRVIVAEVEQKSSSTGQHPEELFGAAPRYANNWGKDPRLPSWAKALVVVAFVAFGLGVLWLSESRELMGAVTWITLCAPVILWVAWVVANRSAADES
ncbi:hypothetical protein IEU95_08925 [Hoyosella rhizosphaerae]|uniref:Uncharacterized protein n=1 Tax=Hoyosella rhizosphaerae TaxID=1755582 RepID=A0A916X9R8_9ACTN|nr:hypothetical protein [Hoyosella rhizosphaerae]MBN4926953.1 hypothetical protein [Hoyosella rhizosphaerae]GGC55201.1 hypothetical protein GCM10011410_04500 [Hoyosella rhizosphaerae]